MAACAIGAPQAKGAKSRIDADEDTTNLESSMPLTLEEALANPETRPLIVNDAVTVLGHEVERKTGLTGIALRAGYSFASKLNNGRLIPLAVDGLLDPFAAALQPLHTAHLEEGGSAGFGDYLVRHKEEASNALLAITDQRADRHDNVALVAAYRKLRSMAVRHVQEALPAVGGLVDRYTTGSSAQAADDSADEEA